MEKKSIEKPVEDSAGLSEVEDESSIGDEESNVVSVSISPEETGTEEAEERSTEDIVEESSSDEPVEVPAEILAETSVGTAEGGGTVGDAGRRHLVRSAALVSIGNLGSSVLGMVRQAVTAGLLGTTVLGAFSAALTPLNNFNQLLANGSTDGALVPVFNEYAAPEKRQELRRVVFTVVNLVMLIGLAIAIIYVFIAPWFVNVLADSNKVSDPAAIPKILLYSQIVLFGLVILGPFAVLLAALFALKEFGWPAFATSAFHVGIIIGSIAFFIIGDNYIGNIALPLALLIGAAGQIILLLPGIRNQRLAYMFVLDLKHPAIRRILKLYWPIAISYAFSSALVFLDLSLQLRTHEGVRGTAVMGLATVLIQFPIGLVAQALSVAVLPTLSEHARENNTDHFKDTLMLGVRMGLLLMIPAMVGLIVLGQPIVHLLFAHYHFNNNDAGLTVAVLQNYAYQLPFVAIDQLLIAAFYARKNTRTPVMIGIVSILFYLVVALPFYSTRGVAALAFANTMQNTSHAIILLILLRLAIGPLHARQAMPAILKISVAAALMGLVAWGIQIGLGHVALFSITTFLGQILTMIVAGGAAVVVYFGAILLFKVEEINLVKSAVLKKLGKK